MKTRLPGFLTIALLVLVGCATPEPEETPAKTGREVVERMIAAHGGLEKWRTAPTVSFEDTLQPAGGAPMISRVTVEQGPRRAYLDFPQMDARITWDGEKAWSENWQGPFPPRFLALLSYYFANLPWLAADPGVNLSEPGTGTLWDDPTEYITVNIIWRARHGRTTRLVARAGRKSTCGLAYEELDPRSPLAVPYDRVVYAYRLDGNAQRVHTGLGLGPAGTAAALLEDLRTPCAAGGVR